MHDHGGRSWKPKIVRGAGILAVFCFPALLAAGSIAGVVRNQTLDRPAAGDEVILLGVGQGAQEEAHTTTDPQGAFVFDLLHSDKPHMVRVIHQGVHYDRQVSGGNALLIEVADAAAKVRGISGGIEIIRAGTRGNLLHVSDMVEIGNLSTPPMTQASERSFEVYLPGDARIDSVLAAGPDNIGEMISATPVHDEPGHYTVNFPLRPGATKFAFNYDLPYNGRITFRAKTMYPLHELAIMIPPTMRFTSRSPAFRILPVGNDRYQVEAAEQVNAREELEFEISGAGALPPMQAQVHVPPKTTAGAPTSPSFATRDGLERPAQGGKTPATAPVSKPPASKSRPQWWILCASAVSMLAVCGILVLRSKQAFTKAGAEAVSVAGDAEWPSASLVEGLKDRLFQLETDRLQGSIRKEEYAVARRALEGSIEWALGRAGSRGRANHLPSGHDG